MRQQVFDYIKKEYKVSPEFPWRGDSQSAVFRHTDNRKWFGLLMNVPRDRLGLPGGGDADVLNLKVDDLYFRDTLIREEGIMPAYHMNKLHWITVLLDGTVAPEQVYDLIDRSFMATASKKKQVKLRPPKDWLVPANPKYYDVEQAFSESDEIEWKQGSGIKVGDTVFLYMAAPVSAVLYQCKVMETDIPCQYEDQNLTIRSAMRIRLLKRYRPEQFTMQMLREEYGIYAVRGPRGVPNSLGAALRR